MEQQPVVLDRVVYAFSQLNWVDSYPNLPVQITNVVIPPMPSRVYEFTEREEGTPRNDNIKLESSDILAFDVTGSGIITPKNITMYLNMENSQFFKFLDLITQQLKTCNTIEDADWFYSNNWTGIKLEAPSFILKDIRVWIIGFTHLGYYMEVDTSKGPKKYVKLKIDMVESLNSLMGSGD